MVVSHLRRTSGLGKFDVEEAAFAVSLDGFRYSPAFLPWEVDSQTAGMVHVILERTLSIPPAEENERE